LSAGLPVPRSEVPVPFSKEMKPVHPEMNRRSTVSSLNFNSAQTTGASDVNAKLDFSKKIDLKELEKDLKGLGETFRGSDAFTMDGKSEGAKGTSGTSTSEEHRKKILKARRGNTIA
jgi:hypothetical protein